MAEITSLAPSFDMSPVAAGFLGAAVLVVSVSVSVFLWSCCAGRVEKRHHNPPYKFIHMLKGISIYPETLSNKKKSLPRRDTQSVDAENPRGSVDTAEVTTSHKDPNGLATSIQEPPASPSPPQEDLGSLGLSVDYNFPKKALVVTIQEARALPVMDEQSHAADPYIKMTILPDKKHRVKTRVLRKTLHPVFDETFTFYGIPYSQLHDLVLHFLILSFNRFSRHDVIGEVTVPLAGLDPSTGRVQITREITKRSVQKSMSGGELQVSLSYQPVAQRMTVVVLKAKHLPRVDITGLSDPYVKVNVYYGRKRIAKKKTHVKRCTLSPTFNESFIYDIPSHLLSDITIEFLVIDFDRSAKNQAMGRLILGAHSVTAAGMEHWQEVCDNPRQLIAKWHSLAEY
ncbi:synaptotagmin-11 [Mantella aurantiaca]